MHAVSRVTTAVALWAIVWAALTAPPLAAEQPAPEPPTGRTDRALAIFERMAVAAAHPIAADVGYAILKLGGHAVDAAVAVQAVLGLVEPQSSGIGGGGFALVYSAREDRVRSWDGREAAPAAAGPDRFVGAGGRPLAFRDAVVSARSIGIPGTIPMLAAMHRAYGRLPWSSLFAPAIELAEKGFPVGARLNAMLAAERSLRNDPSSRAYFYDAAGEPWPVGHRLRNPEYAASLRAIAVDGERALMIGPLAGAIVARATSDGDAPVPGPMTLADLMAYRAIERPPVCSRYRQWRICGVAPPSSGGIAIAQMLAFLEPLPLARWAPGPEGLPPVDAVHALAEAGRLAFADRNRYVADPAFVPVPSGLLDPVYLGERSRLLHPSRSMGRAEPGEPPAAPLPRAALADDEGGRSSGTSHVSIVDRDGNAVALTTSIEDAFGARRMVGGFLLNNQLTDFAFLPREAHDPPRLVANRVEAGKRPRSSMSPTLAFDPQGRLAIVTGSPGGSHIIGYVVKNLVAMIDWGLDAQSAAALPNFGSRNGPTELERDTPAATLREALSARGHTVSLIDMTSGVQTLRRTASGWEGGADPRREGAVRGE